MSSDRLRGGSRSSRGVVTWCGAGEGGEAGPLLSTSSYPTRSPQHALNAPVRYQRILNLHTIRTVWGSGFGVGVEAVA